MPHNVTNWREGTCNPEEALQTTSRAVTVVGVGALGSQIALELTRCSRALLPSVTLIDPDTVQSDNIPASDAWTSLINETDGQVIGDYKSDCLARFCKQRAPFTQWRSETCEIADVGWKKLMDSDVIITCTDSLMSRMETAYATRMLGIPMLDAGVMGPGFVGGRVAYYAPNKEAACYSCGVSTGTRAMVLEHLASKSLSCAALPLPEAMGISPEGLESVRAVAKRVVRELPLAPDISKSFAWRMRDDTTETVHLPVSKDCPWHHETELIALEDDRPIRDSLRADDILLLPWPMVLTAMCSNCGKGNDRPMRLPRLRREGRCPHCGAITLVPERVLERICNEDDVAERTPGQLGLPQQAAFPVRKRIQTFRTF